MSTAKQREARRHTTKYRALLRRIDDGAKRTAERAEARLVKRAKLAAGPNPSEWIKAHYNFLIELQPDPEAAARVIARLR